MVVFEISEFAGHAFLRAAGAPSTALQASTNVVGDQNLCFLSFAQSVFLEANLFT